MLQNDNKTQIQLLHDLLRLCDAWFLHNKRSADATCSNTPQQQLLEPLVAAGSCGGCCRWTVAVGWGPLPMSLRQSSFHSRSNASSQRLGQWCSALLPDADYVLNA
jgi:hypothetical protein